MKLLKTILYPLGIGLFLVAAFPPFNNEFMAFIILAMFLYGLAIAPCGFWYGWLFYFGAASSFIGSWFSYYLIYQLHLPHISAYSITGALITYSALYIGIITWIYKYLKSQYHAFNLIILFPALWVLTELIRGFFFPRSWYIIGNTQVNNLIFRGYYPLFGVYFVSWLVLVIAGLITYIYLMRPSQHTIKIVAGIIILWTTLSYILANIAYTTPVSPTLKIALVQPNIPSTYTFNIKHIQQIELAIQKLIAPLPNVDLIVLPETVFATDYHYLDATFLQQLQLHAKQISAQLIFGSPIHLLVNSPQTGILEINHLNQPLYIKHFLVPFGEYNPLKNTFVAALIYKISDNIHQYTPGQYIQPAFTVLNNHITFNICYENSINDFVAANASNSTIILNIADLSWYGPTIMQDVSLQFSQARALENQRYMLQASTTGRTVIINNHGQIEQQLPAFESGVLLGVVTGYNGITPFERWGNIPIWLLCLFSILCAIWLKYIPRKINNNKG